LKNFIENPAAPANDVAISQYPKSAPEGPVMGYSIRNERYRATFWRERNGARIIATELYDEQDDPDKKVSLADNPEHKDLLDSLVKHLSPVGSDLNPAAKPKGKGKSKTPTKPAPAADDRGDRFDKLDKGKTGKLTRDYDTTHQSDAAVASERFTKWDTDKDGFLSREEYLKQGK
jgi:hypothetical protein